MKKNMARPQLRSRDSDSGSVRSWTLTAAAALALSVGLVLRGTATPGAHQPLQPEGARSVASPETSLGDPEAGREALPETAAVTYLDPFQLLPSFWGADWPKVEAELFPGGLESASLTPILPWDDVRELHLDVLAPDRDHRVEALYRRLMSWPGWEFYGEFPVRPDRAYAKLTPTSLASALRVKPIEDLDQAQVGALEEQFRAMNSELDGLLRAFIEGAGVAVRFEFERGVFDRAPVAFPGMDPEFDDELYSRKVTAGGWVTRIQITATHHPSLGLLRNEIEALRARRRVAVLATLADA